MAPLKFHMAGKFIVFEGIDGSGKETQIAMLARRLIEMDIKFALFKYPTEKAKKVHGYLAGKEKVGEDELLELYSNDIQSEQEDIGEAVTSGWAIADRYVISTAAYQGAGGKLEKRISELDKSMWISPDVVIWLDIGVDEAMRRKGKQKIPDVHEKNRKFLQQVSENYSKLYEKRWLTPFWKKIDANREKEAVFASICQALGL